ncbi:hypothetical protein ACFWMP_31295 [Paenibacillus sp. NPDC058367]|uniref:hypothetical protein n=1 Tax=Paenibacillus sp. NPDC058367 TaxID=3346460 RepID=UPI00365670D5
MKRVWSLLILGLLLMPGITYGDSSNGLYTINKTDYAGTAVKGVPATIQLKTASGSTKYVLPSDIVGTFYQAYIRVGRTLNAENYLTVTFGDGATIIYNNNSWAAQGVVTVPESDFANHPSRGITVKFTHSGDYDENLYLQGYWVTGSATATPTPSATVKPSATPTATVKPTATPSGTSNPNPTASATTSPSESPNPTDPGGGTGDPGECSAACQSLIDQLECPEWDEYMGAWADMIRGTYPPPPNWYNVAEIMRDTIVPSMGQEMVNRSPEIARIIADEFQSREKAVSPPPTIADFKPNVPRISDTPKVSGNLNDNVPNFQPDYSEDKGFVIPDPASIQFNDNSDKGYEYQPINSATPTFSAPVEPSATDKGYKDSEPTEITPPKYVGGRYTPEETAPPYKPDEVPDDTMPGYGGNENTGDYRNYNSKKEVFQGYKGGE